MTGNLRVLAVDDHPIAVKGLEQVLETAFPGCQVWAATRTRQAIDLADRLRPDLILLDLRLPEKPSVPDTCRMMRSRGVTAPIVIITAFEDDELIKDCLTAGAAGCLLKDTAIASLSAALRRVLRGGRVLDPRIQRTLGAHQTGPSAGGPVLTAREQEVLKLLADGLSNRDIADRIDLTESTVKWHVRKVMDKLDARSRWQAVLTAQDRGLV